MILDKLLFEQISPIGESLLKKAQLDHCPNNLDEMAQFLETLKLSYEKQEFDGLLVADILFSFVSCLEVRDRHTTARTFEDIFGALFSSKATDRKHKRNPDPSDEIVKLNNYNTINDNWKISTDLAGNKREKADIFIGNYQISLKTLRGIAFDENGNPLPQKIKDSNDDIIDNNINKELNVGSLSYRALLKGLISDEELDKLRDRKGGLGSGSAIRTFVLDKIKQYGNADKFVERLFLFMNYVYDEDLYIVLKSNYQIKWILIPSNSFIESIVKTYKYHENEFEKIWYRWENNNLRLNWIPLIDRIKEYGLKYKEIVFNLGAAVNSQIISEFKTDISEKIKQSISEMLKKGRK